MQDCGHTLDWPGDPVERVMRNGKKIYASAFKVWLVEQASKPGASVAGLAMRHGVNANQLRRWMRLEHLSGRPAPLPALLPVTIAPQIQPLPSETSQRTSIEIALGGAVVRVGEGADARQLRMVIEVLRA